MPTERRYVQARMPVLLNLRIALTLYGEHATPSSAASKAPPKMFMHKYMSGGGTKSYLTSPKGQQPQPRALRG